MANIDRSLMRPFNWTLTFDKIKDVVFYTQELTLPDMSLDTIEVNQDPTKWVAPGDKIIYGPELSLKIIMDERLKAYEALYNWFWEIRNPVDNRSHKEIHDCFSDCSVTIRGNNQQVIGVIRYIDCFPMRLGGLTLQTTATDDTPITVDASFGYLRFEWVREGFPVIPPYDYVRPPIDDV